MSTLINKEKAGGGPAVEAASKTDPDVAEGTDDLFTDASEYYRKMLQDLETATSVIDFEVYMFENDEVGQQFIDAFVAAAKRNVKVRLLVDGVGSTYWSGNLPRQLDQAGIESRIYNSIPMYAWQWSRSNVYLPLISKIMYLVIHMNRRDHRKLCLIDNRIVWTGSINISRHHLAKERGGEGWHDIGVRLEGIDTSCIAEAFDKAWGGRRYFRRPKKLPITGAVRLNDSAGRRRKFYQDLLRRLTQAQERIWIINAYFVPRASLLRRLRAAARKGIDVRLILPAKSDVFFIPWVSAALYGQLLKDGVRIFEFMPAVLHAKAVIIDDWMIVGSSNLDHRSLLHDLEVDAVLQTKKSRFKLERQFLADIEQSREVRQEHLPQYPLWRKAISRMLSHLKYWL